MATRFSVMPRIKKNSMAFSPQANFTERATATGRPVLVSTFVDRGASLQNPHGC
jgi:hypothetical protein